MGYFILGAKTMAHVSISKNTFNDKDGKPVTYERLAIVGYISGEIQTLEIKLEKPELMLAKILLNSEDEAPVIEARKANEEEIDNFLDEIVRK